MLLLLLLLLILYYYYIILRKGVLFYQNKLLLMSMRYAYVIYNILIYFCYLTCQGSIQSFIGETKFSRGFQDNANNGLKSRPWCAPRGAKPPVALWIQYCKINYFFKKIYHLQHALNVKQELNSFISHFLFRALPIFEFQCSQMHNIDLVQAFGI